jgi:hypothetical protein
MVSPIQTAAEIIYSDCDEQPCRTTPSDLLWHPIGGDNKIHNAADAMMQWYYLGGPKAISATQGDRLIEVYRAQGSSIYG